jgi:hypothetical protein
MGGELGVGRWIRRILGLLVIGFVLFYLVNQPQGAADSVRGILAALGGALQSLVTFFTALTG